MASLTDYWPSWGSTGTKWSSGGDWKAQEQVSEVTMDYLFDSLNKFQNEIHSYLETDGIAASRGGNVDNGDAKLVYIDQLADGEELHLTKTAFVQPDGTAVPSGCDLVIVSDASDLDSGSETVRTTIASGGSTHLDDTGSPLASYTNSTGSSEVVGVLVDNGNWNAGSGSAVNHHATVKGRTQ